jgi:hypothetical protein
MALSRKKETIMTTRKLVTAVSIAILCLGAGVVFNAFRSAPPNAVLYWQPLIPFTLPAFVLVLLLLLSFRLSGKTYQALLLGAAGVLVILLGSVPVARIPSALSLLVLPVLYLSNRQRSQTKNARAP